MLTRYINMHKNKNTVFYLLSKKKIDPDVCFKLKKTPIC